MTIILNCADGKEQTEIFGVSQFKMGQELLSLLRSLDKFDIEDSLVHVDNLKEILETYKKSC